ncbi:MAG: TolC family protein [bacterium]
MIRKTSTILVRSVTLSALLVLLIAVKVESGNYEAPFDSTAVVDADDSLSLAEVLTLVARNNPGLQALVWQEQAMQGELRQALLWPNPELQTEFEEVDWDAPGFSESEFSLTLSQEFELLGQRSARKQLARSQIEATKQQSRLEAFDLFLKTKEQFYAVAHAQVLAILADSSAALMQEMVDNISGRIEKGAAPQSELLLARLELQEAELEQHEALQELTAAREELAGSYQGQAAQAKVICGDEPALESVLEALPRLSEWADFSRSLLQLQSDSAVAEAQRKLASAEARPSFTLSAGYRHFQADGSSSLLFGIGLPLPLFDRNQGSRAGLDNTLRSIQLRQQNARLQAAATLHAGCTRLQSLVSRHGMLDTLLIPTAQQIYSSLHDEYSAGRIPFTNLLQARRSLMNLRSGHNDILLDIRRQIIELEHATGAILKMDLD